MGNPSLDFLTSRRPLVTFKKKPMRHYIRLACLAPVVTEFLACAGTVQAQVAPETEPYVWKSVKIVAGGFITGIVFSPKEPGLAYCRTDIGGAYRIDNKSERWFSLTDWVGPRNSNLGAGHLLQQRQRSHRPLLRRREDIPSHPDSRPDGRQSRRPRHGGAPRR